MPVRFAKVSKLNISYRVRVFSVAIQLFEL